MIERAFSPAKINLFLYVTSRRDDRYHELYTLMTCLDFGDRLSFDYTCPGVAVVCDHPDVPEDCTNLVHRAATLFFDAFSRIKPFCKKKTGVCVSIHKKIPVGAGLGGGSSNAAVTLQVLNRRFGSPFSKQALMAMGLKLGTDVPFFIHGGPALARGVGEQLLICAPLLPYHVVVYFPGLSVRTSLVYENVNLALTKKVKTNNNAVLNAHGKGQPLDVKGLLHNDLEPVACRIYPALIRVREDMAGFKPDGLLMTGSGSSYFALFSDGLKAQQAFKLLSETTDEPHGRVFMASFLKGNDFTE
ncbi:IspE [Desulforapulum autotrophicum HRM2]|uniref:4-diphosphocytidyl-2-C-methyl-D-erythritol kinase n=1 Tax=Desulforapulum autotrophicum (strain ATCC 43914 / DSM 3382 / VKM B-1955 / HRM2) TaxID=177437 RepID=C0QAY8_DESAH|nr:4-(cytidine 5'-diphospho)-2-C-methyl-D-erythritol kinase [Desulforapulum autotrophicum]ACN14787.1 IspE [Desulforapulum autotrophicum HRM2]